MPNFKESPHGSWNNPNRNPDLPPDISPSRVKKWLDCPKQYEYQYVRGLRTPPGLAAQQGSALHDVFLEEFLAEGGVKDVDALVDLCELALRNAVEEDHPHDYKTKDPLTGPQIEQGVQELRTWAKGLFESFLTGKDPYGNPLDVPNIVATEVEKAPLEITLPKSGKVIRIRGYIDFIEANGALGDLKLASDYYLAVWSLAKALGEVQPIMYRMLAGGPGTFKYLIVDKKKNFKTGQSYSPAVRTIEFEVTPSDIDRMIDTLEAFVHQTDVTNAHKDGFFPPVPAYGGESRANKDKPEVTFCGKLCSFKDICYSENFRRPIDLNGVNATISE